MEDQNIRKGQWMEDEDVQLTRVVGVFGEKGWDFIARVSGLRRTGKSCRLRWMNYLRPDLKHGRLTRQEEETILQLHVLWGNKWSRIARKLPGRTDNEIKNYWRTHSRKKAKDEEREKGRGQEASSRGLPKCIGENNYWPSTPHGCIQEEAITGSLIPQDSNYIQHNIQPDEDPFAMYQYEATTLTSSWKSENLEDHDYRQNPNFKELDHGECAWEYCEGSLWDL